jgi:hypothetical protein
MHLLLGEGGPAGHPGAAGAAQGPLRLCPHRDHRWVERGGREGGGYLVINGGLMWCGVTCLVLSCLGVVDVVCGMCDVL